MTKDPVQLAKWMLRWRELNEELSGLEVNIKHAVLEGRKTEVIAGVRARYSKGKTSYNYKGAVMDAKDGIPEVALALDRAVFAETAKITIETLSSPVYTEIAKSLKLTVMSSTGKPSVSIVMDKEEEEEEDVPPAGMDKHGSLE